MTIKPLSTICAVQTPNLVTLRTSISRVVLILHNQSQREKKRRVLSINNVTWAQCNFNFSTIILMCLGGRNFHNDVTPNWVFVVPAIAHSAR